MSEGRWRLGSLRLALLSALGAACALLVLGLVFFRPDLALFQSDLEGHDVDGVSIVIPAGMDAVASDREPDSSVASHSQDMEGGHGQVRIRQIRKPSKDGALTPEHQETEPAPLPVVAPEVGILPALVKVTPPLPAPSEYPSVSSLPPKGEVVQEVEQRQRSLVNDPETRREASETANAIRDLRPR